MEMMALCYSLLEKGTTGVERWLGVRDVEALGWNWGITWVGVSWGGLDKMLQLGALNHRNLCSLSWRPDV